MADDGDDLIDLVAPAGTDEANHGMQRYRVDNSGVVRVPPEAARELLRIGGFKVMPKSKVLVADSVPGMERLVAPSEDAASNTAFTPASETDPLEVWVPADQKAILLESHGFRLPGQPAPIDDAKAEVAVLKGNAAAQTDEMARLRAAVDDLAKRVDALEEATVDRPTSGSKKS